MKKHLKRFLSMMMAVFFALVLYQATLLPLNTTMMDISP